ncbi:hypothetical protein ACIA8O_10880 [Kitasatospora sp. NPDC051853]|uniref:hypothetical protein n=1 Tax=Kitasatospora sp. NPDC051853 TaxID=3364058 RepID=UPI0037996EC8
MRKNVLRRATAVLLSAAAIALAAPAVTASADGVQAAFLQSGQRLNPGEKLVSGGSALVMQWDGNLVVRLVNDQGDLGPELWASGTYNNWAAYAYMQPDGNFVIYRQNGGPDQGGAIWHTGSWGHPGSYISLYEGSLRGNGFSWETQSGMAIAVSNGGWHPESVFNSGRGVAPGYFLRSNSVWLVNQRDGNMVLYRKRDGAALWSTGTWNQPASTFYAADVYGGSQMYLRVPNSTRMTWSVSFRGQTNVQGKLQDDGNFVIYSQGGQALWSTGTYGNW